MRVGDSHTPVTGLPGHVLSIEGLSLGNDRD
jgi:hypothetical protein